MRLRSGFAIFVCFFLFIPGSEAGLALSYGATAAKVKTNPNPKPSARLIIQRAANFGGDAIVQLSIDGKKTANIPRNQHYGGIISAGGHSLTVRVLPNTMSRRPTSIQRTFKSGKAYIYTVGWLGDRLVLQPSTTYTPTQAVKPIGQKKSGTEQD